MPTFGNVENTDWVKSGGATVGSVVATLPPHSAGNLLLLFAACDHSTNSFNTPSGYTDIGLSANNKVRAFYKIAGSSEADPTVALSSGTANIKVLALKITSFNASSVINTFADTTNSSGAVWSTPSLTTTVNDTLIFVGGGASSTLAWTAGDEPDSSTLVAQINEDSMWFGLAFFPWPTAGSTAGNAQHRWSNTQQSKHSFSIAIAPSAGDTTPPTITAGPTVSNVTAAGFDVSATANEDGTARLLVTAYGAAQPNNAAFDASTETATVTADTEFTIHHTGQ